ncbi:MAG: restriction endonuclease subunit S [candidate division Zixibacteria bacterium]|nr:restriction endonuclease subunit S [candidate division Zixibacteria bacterium]
MQLTSAALYTQAEGLLLAELGFHSLDRSPTLFYERPFSEAREVGRLDAEYYQPMYYRLIDAIHRTGKGRLLGEIVTHCERGLQPEYDEDGDVAVVNSKHMDTQFLTEDYEHCTHEAWTKQKKARLKQYDVLFYSTGAYIGRTNCWLGDGKAIGSNHVTIIRPNTECNPAYLALFMNSQAGLMQADRHAHGSAQREVYPNDLRAYTVWLPPLKKQEKLAGMVLDAKTTRDESRRLLDEAKAMVEDAVLRGV